MTNETLERELDECRVVDFRLSQQKDKLAEIHDKQDELLKQLYQREPDLAQDFCQARAERLQELAAKEQESLWLLATWTF